ncbi:terminase large subunit [Paenibacillus larvae]|nr:terminase TerL endonuclease subunit [Paenibacillus larvae]MDT2277426.1 terminase large subunit [Paenibacillus larvae]
MGKANPNLGVTYDLEKLKNAWEKKSIPAERSEYDCRRFNVFVKADEMSFIGFNTLRKNNKHLDIDSLNGETAIGSFDLSESEDFTSACLEFPLDTEKC